MAIIGSALEIRVGLTSNDKGVKQLNREVQQLTKQVRLLDRELGRSNKTLIQKSRELARLQNSAARASGQLRQTVGTTTGVRNAFLNARRAAFFFGTTLASLGVGFSLRRIVQTLRDFGREMSAVAAVTGATGGELESLQETARALGAKTVFTAPQVAEGMRLLSQAGFETNEVLDALPGTLALATVGMTDMATAANITSSVIRGFGLNAEDATEVTDALAVVASKSNTNIADLGNAMKFVSAAARSANQDFTEVASALGALADVGLRGTIAGTGLRRVLIGLVNPTAQGERALKRMGLTVKDLDPRVTKLSDILRQFSEHSLGASEAFDLFGLRGGPAALALTLMSEKFNELNERIREGQGVAEDMAAIMRDNLEGDIRIANSAIDELILGTTALNEALRNSIQFFTAVIQALNGTISPSNRFFKEAVQIKKSIEAVVQALKDFSFVLKTLGLISFAALIGTLATRFLTLVTAARAATTAVNIFKLSLAATGVFGIVIAVSALIVELLRLKGVLNDTGDELDFFFEQQSKQIDKLKARLSAAPTVEARQAALSQIEELRESILTDLSAALKRFEKIREEVTSAVTRDLVEKGLRTDVADLSEGALEGFVAASKRITDEVKDRFQETRKEIEIFDKILSQLRSPDIFRAQDERDEIRLVRDELENMVNDLDRITAIGAQFNIDTSKAEEKVAQLEEQTREVAKLLEKNAPVIEIRAKISEIDLRRQFGLDAFDSAENQRVVGQLEAILKSALERRNKLIEAGRLDDVLQKSSQASIDAARSFIDRFRSGAGAADELLASLTRLNKLEKEQQATIRDLARAEQRRATALREVGETVDKQINSIRTENLLLRTNRRERESLATVLEIVNRLQKAEVVITDELREKLVAYFRALRDVEEQNRKTFNTFNEGFRAAADEFAETAQDAAARGRDAFENMAADIKDVIGELIETGDLDFQAFAARIGRRTSDQFIDFTLGKASQAAIESGSFDRFFGTQKTEEGGDNLSTFISGFTDAVNPAFAALEQAGKDLQEVTAQAAQVDEQTSVALLESVNSLSAASDLQNSIASVSQQAAALQNQAAGTLATASTQLQTSGTQLSSAAGNLTGAATQLTSAASALAATGASSDVASTAGNSIVAIAAGSARRGGISGNLPDRVAVDATAFNFARKFQSGGMTSGPFGGGDGIPAILHPNEAVVPLDKQQRIPLDVRNGEIVVPLPGFGRTIKVGVGKFQRGGISDESRAIELRDRVFRGAAQKFQMGGVTKESDSEEIAENIVPPVFATDSGSISSSLERSETILKNARSALGKNESVIPLDRGRRILFDVDKGEVRVSVPGFRFGTEETPQEFQSGGLTGGPKIGGREIPAILHPNEAVIPLNEERRIPLEVRNGEIVVPLPGFNRDIKVGANGFRTGGVAQSAIPPVFDPDQTIVPLDKQERIPMEIRGGEIVIPIPGFGREVKIGAKKFQDGGAVAALGAPIAIVGGPGPLISGNLLEGVDLASIPDLTATGGFSGLGGVLAGLQILGLVVQILHLINNLAADTSRSQGTVVSRGRLGIGIDTTSIPGISIGGLSGAIALRNVTDQAEGSSTLGAAFRELDFAELENLGAVNTGGLSSISFRDDLQIPENLLGLKQLGPVVGFADGGIVNRPTLGMVGEGGSPEAIIPLKGGAVPVSIQGPTQRNPNVVVSNVNVNIVTPDADSFRASEGQIAALTASSLRRASERNR